jgi:4-amino-4-deoxy-L-arabinose transferase-like glycosyltransferase
MAITATAIPMTQQKTELRFTNRFPSHLRAAILGPRVKSATRNYALLFVGCLLFHMAGTSSLPLIDRDEPRFAEASREMIERGDYIVPYFNNQLRLDKPPLAYWAQVASYRILGQNDFAARFPSTIAAALVAMSIFAWASRIGGERVAWWAAIIFTLALQTFVHAKAAVADMWLVLFVTLAHWSGYELMEAKQTLNAQRSTPNAQWNWWWIFYFALAVGFLAKGPIAWTPLLTVGWTIFFARDLQLARRFKFVRGILLVLAIVSLWGIPALIQTHGDFFWIGIGRHVIGRSFGAMEGHGATSFPISVLLLPFYFVTIFASFFPWSIKLPWLGKKLWRQADKIDIYLLAGTAIIFFTFTFVKTKLPHYTLPALPLVALLLARHWPERSATFFKSIAIAAVAVWLAIALVVPPLVAQTFPAYALFQQSRPSLEPGMEFGAVDYNEPSLVWYFRSRVNGFLTPLNKRSAVDFMAKTGPRFVIIPTSLAATLFVNNPENWKVFSTRGFNIAKGKHVDLTLVLKEN